jgi:hypothetical protein
MSPFAFGIFAVLSFVMFHEDEAAYRRYAHIVGISIPFLLLPAVIECPWPTLYLGWVLVAAVDAAFTAARNDLVDTSDCTIFGLDTTKLEPAYAVVSTLICLAAALLGLLLGHALFGHLYKHQECIVGIWDVDKEKSVEFTINGYVLIQPKSSQYNGQARFRWVDRNTLEIFSSGGFMKKSQTDRYAVEFLSQNEMLLVAEGYSNFDDKIFDTYRLFPNIAGKLRRAGTSPTNESEAQPNPALLGRWIKPDSRNEANEMESIVITAETLLYLKPSVWLRKINQRTTPLKWVSGTKAKLVASKGTVQFDIVSNNEIIVSTQNVGYDDFQGIDGLYRRADRKP